MSKSIRIEDEIVRAATTTAARSHRSTAEQVNYWAAVGRRVTSATGVDQRRLEAVVAGAEQFSTLADDERVIAHARIDADIEQRMAATSLGGLARLDGVTTATMDEDGTIVLTSPDGTSKAL